MSVTTSADESKKLAIDSIEVAIRSLANIVIDKQWGHDEYNAAYKKKLREAMNQLIEIEESLS